MSISSFGNYEKTSTIFITLSILQIQSFALVEHINYIMIYTISPPIFYAQLKYKSGAVSYSTSDTTLPLCHFYVGGSVCYFLVPALPVVSSVILPSCCPILPYFRSAVPTLQLPTDNLHIPL